MRKTIKRRFLVCWIDPSTGRERLGTETNLFMHYANVDNVIKFGMLAPGVKEGQHNIYSWPEGGTQSTSPVRVAYKRAGVNG